MAAHRRVAVGSGFQNLRNGIATGENFGMATGQRA